MRSSIFCDGFFCQSRVLGVGLALAWALSAGRSLIAATFEGFAEPYQQIDVSAGNEPGVIEQIFFREGDAIRQGDVVAALDSDVLEASLKIAQYRAQLHGRLDAASAEYRMRHSRLAKLQQLSREGHASPAEIERASADAEVARAQVELAREERELAQLECKRIEAQIERRRFRSPIDGVVVEIVRDVGESTIISDPRLMTLVQLHPLRVKFPMSRSAGAELQAGDTVEIEMPEIKRQVQAEIEVVSPVLDAKSGTVQVTCVLDNQQGQYRAGMRCLLQAAGDDPEPETVTDSLSDF